MSVSYLKVICAWSWGHIEAFGNLRSAKNKLTATLFLIHNQIDHPVAQIVKLTSCELQAVSQQSFNSHHTVGALNTSSCFENFRYFLETCHLAFVNIKKSFSRFYFIIYKIDKEYYEYKTTQNPRSMDLSHCSKKSLILILEAPFLFW